MTTEKEFSKPPGGISKQRKQPKQSNKVKNFREGSVTRSFRFTTETYEILRMYKDNVERITGTRLSDSYAIAAILEGMVGRIRNGGV